MKGACFCFGFMLAGQGQGQGCIQQRLYGAARRGEAKGALKPVGAAPDVVSWVA